MSASGPGRTPYWPDRAALRRRRNARRAFWVAVVLVLVLPWFGYRHVREWLRPGADAPVVAGGGAASAVVDVPPSVVAGGGGAPLAAAPVEDAPSAGDEGHGQVGVDAIGRDARAGDGDSAEARLADLGAQVHREILLADRGSAVRREDARREVADMPGVRAAGWVDRMTMLLLVSTRGSGQMTIAEACRRLAVHGDVTGLAVRVQEVADGAAGAGTLQGECRQLAPAAGLVAGAAHPFPGTPLRPQGTGVSPVDAAPEDPAAAAERRAREQESLRILSEHTPELPAAPPRVDP